MKSIFSREPRQIYTERLVFMAALIIPAVFLMGLRVLLVCGLSLGFCMAADYLCCRLRHIKYDPNDAAVPFWALGAAMLMPSSIPIFQIAVSSVIIVVLGKHIFGSSDNIIFSPVAVAAAFLIVCYPAEMLSFPKAGEHYPVFSYYAGSLTRGLEYTMKLGLVPADTPFNILLGNIPGAIGTVHILIIAVCGVCLLIRRSNSISAVVSCILTAGALAFAYPRVDCGGLMSVFYEFSSGYMLFGIVFIFAEPYTLPKKLPARVLYGIAMGYAVMMFRNFGQTEGSFVFAMLIVNALGCCFDTLFDNLSYWQKTYVNSFEHNKTNVQHGNVKLTDTQEIVLPEKYRYNTPPINSEIKYHRRRGRKENNDGKE